MTDASKPLVTTILRSSWYGLAVVGLLSFFVNLLVLVSPIYMQQVYDRVLTTHHSETLVYLSLFAAVCLVFLALFDIARSYALTRIGRWWDESLRDEVLAAALHQSRLSGQPATGASASSAAQVLRSRLIRSIGAPGQGTARHLSRPCPPASPAPTSRCASGSGFWPTGLQGEARSSGRGLRRMSLGRRCWTVQRQVMNAPELE